MTKEQQKVLAFVIPFVLSIILSVVFYYFSPFNVCVRETYFLQDACEATTFDAATFFSILGLFLLSFILPFFVKSKQKSIKLNELNLTK